MMSWSKALESKRTVIILIFDAEGGALRSFYTFYCLNIDHSNINEGAAIVMRYPMRAIGCIILGYPR
jgi:hypothetical protein